MPKKRILILILLAFCAAFFIWVNKSGRKNEIVSPLGSWLAPEEQIVRKILGIFDPKSGLDHLLEDSIKNRQGTYGIYIKNLKTGETASINADSKLETASLYKLWVAGVVYAQIKNGSINKNEKLESSKYDLYKKMDFDIKKEEEEKLKEEKLEMTVADALIKMITVSDNDSAYLLTDRVGFANINSFLNQNGFPNSKITNPPTSTPREIGSFYEKLYKGEIVNKQSSNELIVLLKSQRINDRIPKYLPNIAVAHKTGELGTLKHDAGIVYGKDPYVLVVLTDTKDTDHAAEFTAELSKQIFSYFESKHKN